MHVRTILPHPPQAISLILTSPVAETLRFSYNVSDADNDLSTIEFYVDGIHKSGQDVTGINSGSSESHKDISGISAGTHSGYYIVYDSSGTRSATSATVTNVTVAAANVAPVAEEFSVIPGDESITFNYRVSDTDGNFSKVEFYTDDSLRGTSYSVESSFVVTGLTNGTEYRCWYKVYDSGSPELTATSNDIYTTPVAPPAPPVFQSFTFSILSATSVRYVFQATDVNYDISGIDVYIKQSNGTTNWLSSISPSMFQNVNNTGDTGVTTFTYSGQNLPAINFSYPYLGQLRAIDAAGHLTVNESAYDQLPVPNGECFWDFENYKAMETLGGYQDPFVSTSPAVTAGADTGLLSSTAKSLVASGNPKGYYYEDGNPQFDVVYKRMPGTAGTKFIAGVDYKSIWVKFTPQHGYWQGSIYDPAKPSGNKLIKIIANELVHAIPDATWDAADTDYVTGNSVQIAIQSNGSGYIYNGTSLRTFTISTNMGGTKFNAYSLSVGNGFVEHPYVGVAFQGSGVPSTGQGIRISTKTLSIDASGNLLGLS